MEASIKSKKRKNITILPFLCATILFFMGVFFINGQTIFVTASESTEAATDENIVTTEYPADSGREPDLVANSAIVIDAGTGQILYEKNAYDKKYPASITKIMTCLLALENCSMDETLTMSYDAIWGIDRDSNHIALDVDEQISMEDGLYALMLESANEVAWAIGEHIAGGSIEDFADMMNAKAAELGCQNTHFTNANGLPDDNHYTTCYDMALITQAALQYEDFYTITGSLSHTIPPTNLCEEERPLWHHCKMIYEGSNYYYEYCEGGKTGYTTVAKNTLVTWCKKDDLELICVIMDCDGTYKPYTDSIALYNYCYENYTQTTPLAEYTFSDEDIVNAENAIDQYLNTTSVTEISLQTDRNFILDINKNWDENAITAAIVYNDTITYDNINNTYDIGEIVYSYNNHTIASTGITASGYTPLTTTSDKNPAATAAAPSVEASNQTENHISIWIILVIILAILIIAFLILNLYVQRQRKQQRLRNAARRRAYEASKATVQDDDELY